MTERSKKNKEIKKIIIINIKYYLNYIIDILNKKRQKYKVEEKRKFVYKSNCERNKIVEVDCQGTKKIIINFEKEKNKIKIIDK